MSEPSYHVSFSAKQNSWFIADEAGECVSGLYDTEEGALSDARDMANAEELLTQVQARALATKLTMAGVPAIAGTVPLGAWAGSEKGWTVYLLGWAGDRPNPDCDTNESEGTS